MRRGCIMDLQMERERELVRGVVEAVERRQAEGQIAVRQLSESYTMLMGCVSDTGFASLVERTFGEALNRACIALGVNQA